MESIDDNESQSDNAEVNVLTTEMTTAYLLKTSLLTLQYDFPYDLAQPNENSGIVDVFQNGGTSESNNKPSDYADANGFISEVESITNFDLPSNGIETGDNDRIVDVVPEDNAEVNGLTNEMTTAYLLKTSLLTLQYDFPSDLAQPNENIGIVDVFQNGGTSESNNKPSDYADANGLFSEVESITNDLPYNGIETGENNRIVHVVPEGKFIVNLPSNGIETGENNRIVDVVPEGSSDSNITLSDNGVHTIENSAIVDDDDDTPEEILVTSVIRRGRPKRGRKTKVPQQSRADRKILHNTNKPHINTKGNYVEEKVFDEDFVCLCSKKCTTAVPLELRKRLSKQFWNMGTMPGRCALLVSCVSQQPKKKTYSKTNMKNRTVTRKYAIFGHDVCKVALNRTLQINERRVALALKKQMTCDSYADCRGTVSGGLNAFPISKRVEVQNHISSFPKYVSHYCRSQTESKFLSATLNLAILYRLYKDKCNVEKTNPVSESLYKRIFYQDFNLRFKKPKKDTCKNCDLYLVKIQNVDEAARVIFEEWHQNHLVQAESLTNQMKLDLKNAKTDPEVEAATYDQQKVLNLPKLPTNIVYYKRQLNMYNLGIHVGSSGKGIFNVWLEYEASKGTQEVGSCLKKYIKTIIAPVKTLFLWSDSCGGQNRSIKLVLMLIHVLQNHVSLETIYLRFLQSGHSFSPNDSDFGDFECLLKLHPKVFTDSQYIQIMKHCRIENKFEVNRMSREDFFSVKNMEDATTNRKRDVNKNKINWLETHEIVIEKSHPEILKMRKKLDGDFQLVNIAKAKCQTDFKNIELQKLWPNGRPLSNEKIKDLKEMLHLVDDEYKSFYEFVGDVSAHMDDVDGFGEAIDFELEE